MSQQLGETKQAMMAQDWELVEKILNRRPTGNYWIVIHHKPTKMRMDTGEQVVMRLVKDYDKEPQELLGTIVLEVKDGEIVNTKVRPHDAPINWEPIERQAGLIIDPTVVQAPSAGAYVYNQ